jgi:hypothetical protein
MQNQLFSPVEGRRETLVVAQQWTHVDKIASVVFSAQQRSFDFIIIFRQQNHSSFDYSTVGASFYCVVISFEY